MFPSFLHCLSLPPGSSEASGLRPQDKPRGVFHSVKHHQDFVLLFGKRQMNVFCFFFYVFHGRKEVIVKKSFVSHGRRIFFLHFLASSTGEEYSFYILLFSAMAEEPLAKTVWRLFMPYIREHRKTTAADLPSDCTQVALDSSRLKSTGDQGKN